MVYVSRTRVNNAVKVLIFSNYDFFMLFLKLRSILNGMFKKHAVYCIIWQAARLKFHKYPFGPRADSVLHSSMPVSERAGRWEEGSPNVLKKDSCTVRTRDRSLGALKYWESLSFSLSAGRKYGGSQMGTSLPRAVCGVINMQCRIRR